MSYLDEAAQDMAESFKRIFITAFGHGYDFGCESKEGELKRLRADNAKLRELVRKVLQLRRQAATQGGRMNECEKALTYEEAKQLCMKAFDGGALYGSESMRYGVNATAYDWEHWLKKNECLFKPKPTVEDVLREFADEVYADTDNEIRDRDFLCAKYAKRLTLAEGEDA